MLAIGWLIASASVAEGLGGSNALWHIVSQCIDTQAPSYCQQCMAPQIASACEGKSTCRQTSEVWAENTQFVAIRDIKMCGCPPDFVHGLVLPKARVTGVEDERRPEAIWSFSWELALQRMPREAIAMVVNPKGHRSQNQLHVHLVRLAEDSRLALLPYKVAETVELDRVWELAEQAAKNRQWTDYGVLVAASPHGGFLVAITEFSPEAHFTQAVCQP